MTGFSNIYCDMSGTPMSAVHTSTPSKRNIQYLHRLKTDKQALENPKTLCYSNSGRANDM